MSAQERILDAAAQVMREQGLARATTKEIARVAGCSEALLYKHFADKQEIFVRVLSERLPPLAASGDLIGTRSVGENLGTVVASLITFYRESFPIAASVFSSNDLLVAHREVLHARGAGPEGPVRHVQHYLDSERDLGRVAAAADTTAVARTVTGAALLEAFLASYEGAEIADPGALAAGIVATVLPALTP